MFGLVRKSRLDEAEGRIRRLRLALRHRTAEWVAADKALTEERALRIATEGERDRLLALLKAQPEEDAPVQTEQKQREQDEPVHVLTGLEVVSRATIHRNTLHKALNAK